MMGMLILLAIGLSALMVIGLVARNLDHAGESPFFAWLGRLFVWSPDRGNWWLMDRRLARIPELTPLDRRERRQLYIDATRSWTSDHPWRYWGSGIMAGTCIGIAQPFVEQLCDRLLVLLRPWPVVDQIPGGLFTFSCTFVIDVLIFVAAFSLIERGVRGRLLEMAHRPSVRPAS